MASRSKSLFARARKLNRQDGIVFVQIIGDPDQRMTSPRIASIGNNHYEAAPDETTEAFHAGMRKVGRRGRQEHGRARARHRHRP
jgi:cyclopropane fatty-acyl-phospholipid synthase-like methyltransferase